MLTDHLGPAPTEGKILHERADLDVAPPGWLLEALVERIGPSIGDLQMMTFAGWVPWLLDTLDPFDGPDAFHTYVRQDSVLLPRAAPAATTSRTGGRAGPVHRGYRGRHGCAGCARCA